MKVAASPQIYIGDARKWHLSHQSQVTSHLKPLTPAFNREPINLTPEPFHSKNEIFTRRPLTHGWFARR